METVFEDVYWIALLITGEAAAANESILCASQLSAGAGGVFCDRLIRKARALTARSAVRTVHRLISTSASSHDVASSKRLDFKVLPDEEIRSLYQVNPREVSTELDPLSRSVLVLRGMQRASISECALLLAVPRRHIINAYSHAMLWWNCKREHVVRRALDAPIEGVL
jgi:tRNA(Met) C34 N-acetyltransferase TmcA